jgi:putative two-component system response regulator
MTAAPAPTTILVVDDEEGVRTVLSRFLSRHGYQVRTAESGPAALALLETAQPAAILSDIRMPHMSGVELVPKALAVDPDVAIIMLTAVDEPRTAIECLRLGAYDYLIKPVDLQELEVSLRGGLRQRELEIERRKLEQWLAREVASRTRDAEARLEALEDVTLDALAATRGWPGEADAVRRLASALDVPYEDLAEQLRRRRTDGAAEER